MRKALLAATVAIATMTSAVTAADFQLDVNAGYGFGMGGELYVDETEKATETGYETTEYDVKFGSVGNGLKFDLAGTIFFNDNVGLNILTGFSTLGGYESTYKLTNLDGSSYESVEKTKLSYIPINVGVRVKGGGEKVSPYAYVAPGMAIIVGAEIEEKETTEGVSETTTIEAKYAPAFTVASGLGVTFNVSEKIGINLEVAPTLGFARLKETSYDKDGKTYTTVYEKESGKLSENTETTQYRYSTEKTNISNVAAKVGVSFNF